MFPSRIRYGEEIYNLVKTETLFGTLYGVYRKEGTKVGDWGNEITCSLLEAQSYEE
jgi:hypothetical protein